MTPAEHVVELRLAADVLNYKVTAGVVYSSDASAEEKFSLWRKAAAEIAHNNEEWVAAELKLSRTQWYEYVTAYTREHEKRL